MYKLITLISILLSTLMYSQKVYDLDIKTPKTFEELVGSSEETKDKAVYKGNTYTVYKSKTGKLFIVYMNKKGNYTKKYIPKELPLRRD